MSAITAPSAAQTTPASDQGFCAAPLTYLVETIQKIWATVVGILQQIYSFVSCSGSTAPTAPQILPVVLTPPVEAACPTLMAQFTDYLQDPAAYASHPQTANFARVIDNLSCASAEADFTALILNPETQRFFVDWLPTAVSSGNVDPFLTSINEALRSRTSAPVELALVQEDMTDSELLLGFRQWVVEARDRENFYIYLEENRNHVDPQIQRYARVASLLNFSPDLGNFNCIIDNDQDILTEPRFATLKAALVVALKEGDREPFLAEMNDLFQNAVESSDNPEEAVPDSSPMRNRTDDIAVGNLITVFEHTLEQLDPHAYLEELGTEGSMESQHIVKLIRNIQQSGLIEPFCALTRAARATVPIDTSKLDALYPELPSALFTGDTDSVIQKLRTLSQPT